MADHRSKASRKKTSSSPVRKRSREKAAKGKDPRRLPSPQPGTTHPHYRLSVNSASALFIIRTSDESATADLEKPIVGNDKRVAIETRVKENGIRSATECRLFVNLSEQRTSFPPVPPVVEVRAFD